MPDDPNVQPQGTPDGGTNDDGASQPFLVVDERTRYNSQEEAIQGYQEAGRRIAELTPWQQIASDYGLRDPQEVAALLDELVELRARGSRATPNEPSTVRAPNAPAEGDSTAVDLKQKQALEWLSKNGEAAGMVSKQQLDAINAKLDALEQASQSVDNERFEMRIDAGRNILETEMKGLGVLPADANAKKSFLSFVENALTTWVNADDRRVNAFYGSKEELSELIRAGLQEIMPVLNILKNQPAAAAAASRAVAPNRSRATTPPNRTNAPGKPTGKPNTRDTGEDFTPETHEAAFAALQAAMSRK